MDIFLSIKVHFQGVFFNKPFFYSDGVHHVFENVDFVAMSYNEFVGFLERFTQEKYKKLYYCQPDLQIPEGLTLISNERQYQEFIDIAYECGVQVSVYMDHFGTTVHVTKANENENEDNCFVKSNMSIEGEEGIDLTEIKSPQEINMEGVTYEGVRQGNGNEEATEGDLKDDNVLDVKGKLTFNEDIPWKKQLPILGMRFTNPKQLIFMICKYVVVNGYQLYFEKNDSKRLLVKCSNGQCTFRIWASWMSEEHSFQIKSLIIDHNCAGNFKLGSIVNYRWIGSHFTREVLENQKFNVRMLKEEVKTKIGIEVSMGQCRRSKQHAMSLVKGTIVGNYAKLWSYGEEIKRDGNNHLYPIAWVVVCVENKDNWKWFLENLQEDSHLEGGFGRTLMSDQHNGIIEAVKDLFPEIEHRQCARHVLSNFKKKFPRAQYWQVLPSSLNTFETRNLGESYGVDLEKKNVLLGFGK
ncbi:unnamed protein product [Lactuca saligna]|uniref:Transposase MuDR plant domain-containing protein n=1 Tax=Lactuca saligna TaxID=75948 RepID=A0AA35YA02_LACSI|nr:unnamed protein product [Lactuca saligna]